MLITRKSMRIFVPWVVILSAGVASTGCSRKAPPTHPQSVTAIRLAARPTALTQEYPGQTEAFNTVEIRPQVGGILKSQAAVEGQHVSAGQVLFEIDSQPYIATRAQALAMLAQAHAAQAQAASDLARARPLSALDALSQKELDAAVAASASADAQVKSAEAAVKTAELNLGYTVVRAPIGGVMSRTLIRLGGLVTAYTSLLTTVYETDPMYVNFSIGEQRLLELQHELGRAPDQLNPSQREFRIFLADGSEYPLPAQLNFVDAAVDQRTDTLAMRVAVPNPHLMLRAGRSGHGVQLNLRRAAECTTRPTARRTDPAG